MASVGITIHGLATSFPPVSAVATAASTLLGTSLPGATSSSTLAASAAVPSVAPPASHPSTLSPPTLPPSLPSLPSGPGQIEDGDGGSSISDPALTVEVPLPDRYRKKILNAIQQVLHINSSIPETSHCTHPAANVTIDTGSAPPVSRAQYPVPQAHQKVIQDQLDEWLRKGVVTRTDHASMWNSPLLVAPKRDENRLFTKHRVVLDPRPINKISKIVDMPIPNIEEEIKRVHGAAVFSKLDLKDSYHQFRLSPESQVKLCFTVDKVKYMFVRAPFGIASMTAIFQHAMEDMLDPSLTYVIIYVDDVVVFTKPTPSADSMDAIVYSHIQQLIEVISTLNKWNVRINVAKSAFGFSQLRMLGHVMSGNKHFIDPEKVSTLASFPPPTSAKDVQSFLGFTNYLRGHCPHYAALTKPLDELRYAKNVKSLWQSDPKYQKAFDSIKAFFSAAPVLHAPNPAFPYLVATDASAYGLGAVLYQHYNEANHYVSFASKSLNSAQRNYSATKRELLGVVFSLQKFRYYVLGRPFELHCDHQALAYWNTVVKPSAVIADWLDVLIEYNPNIVYCKGILNCLPDALSRLYPDYLQAAPSSSTFHPTPFPEISLNAFWLADHTLLPENELSSLITHRFTKTCPPEEERKDIVERNHLLGHHGAESLYRKLWGLGYYWPGMRSLCVKTVAVCRQCIRFSIGKRGFHLQHSVDAKFPFDHVAVDTFDIGVTTPRGITYVLVLTDLATRFVILSPLSDKSALSVARAFWHTICLFGVPKIIQSDNGTEFVNAVVAALTTLLGVNHRLSAPYHPQCNGLAESMVKQAKLSLLKQVEGSETDFDLHLPAVQFALNCKNSSLLLSSPFSLMFARPLSPLADYRSTDSSLLSEEELTDRCKLMLEVIYPQMHANARAALLKRTNKANDPASVTRLRAPPVRKETVFNVGDSVMKHDPVRTSKSQPYWVGPYTIMEVTAAKTLRLRDAVNKMVKNPVSPLHVQKISAAAFDADEDVQVVEKILDDRIVNNVKQYLVKWKYMSAASNTWEPASNFDDLQCISVYNRNKAAAARSALSAPTAPIAAPTSNQPSSLPSAPLFPLSSATPLPLLPLSSAIPNTLSSSPLATLSSAIPLQVLPTSPSNLSPFVSTTPVLSNIGYVSRSGRATRPSRR
jgi:transposase InsO family protein